MVMEARELRAFRAQLFLEEQKRLLDYWVSRASGADLPPRSALSPADIVPLLPHVSLIEFLPRPDVIRFRLAGGALWDIYGGEITGHTLDSRDWGETAGYWRRNYEIIAKERKPAAGMLPAPAAGKDHLVQFWLRLPMAGRAGGEMILLGLDICIAASKLENGMAGNAAARAAARG